MLSGKKTVTSNPVERRCYQLTDKLFAQFKAASQPRPLATTNEEASITRRTQTFWFIVGQEMGFKWWTVMPALHKGEKFFTAIHRNEDERARVQFRDGKFWVWNLSFQDQFGPYPTMFAAYDKLDHLQKVVEASGNSNGKN